MSETFLCASDLGPRPRLDRLDPRSRIVAALAAVVVIVTIRSSLVLAAALPLVVLLALATGVAAADLGRRLLHVEGFLLVLVVLLPLTVPGPEWTSLGPLTLSRPGVDRAVAIALRVNLAALTILTLLGGLEPVRLGHALARLGVPVKLVHLVLFAARFVTLVREAARRRLDTLRARAFRRRTSLHTLRTLAHLVGRLLVDAVERAERVDEAMRCRAFAGRFALIDTDHYGPADRRFAGALAVLLLVPLVTDLLT